MVRPPYSARPSYISPHSWDMMTDAEQVEELRILAAEDARDCAPAPIRPPRGPRPAKPRWRVVQPATLSDAYAYNQISGHLYKRTVHSCSNQHMHKVWVRDKERLDPRPAGVLHKSGALVMWWDGKLIYAHRLIWELMTGAPPAGQIRHINGNRSDNRWDNLELVRQVPIELPDFLLPK